MKYIWNIAVAYVASIYLNDFLVCPVVYVKYDFGRPIILCTISFYCECLARKGNFVFVETIKLVRNSVFY